MPENFCKQVVFFKKVMPDNTIKTVASNDLSIFLGP